MNDTSRTMALTMYNADCINTFKCWDDKELKEVIGEISELSLRFPIYEINFEKGYCSKVIKDMNLKYLECNSNNEFTINGISKKYSPLFLMAVLEYGTNRLSNNQIEDKAGFEHLKMAKYVRQKNES